MNTKMLLLAVMICIAVTACAPVTLQKCITEYKYTADGKVQSTYAECLNQTPEKTAPVHLKHQELYE